MRRVYYYIGMILLLCMGCTRDSVDEADVQDEVIIRLSVKRLAARVVDEDNLAEEQTIKNLSIFFTEPSSQVITHSYPYIGFSWSGDYQLISLPAEAAELLTKDVYVIANYDDEQELTTLTTLDEMRELWAPEIDKSNNLDPLNGFCMYGTLSDVDFTDQANYPVTVSLIRICAKLRVNLTFPGNSLLSTSNSFLIQHAATYTHVVPNFIVTLPTDDYFNFAAALPLADNGAGVYMGNAYVYKANQAPVITIYTHLGGSTEEQAFTATLPIPQRNYLYDLMIEIYEEGTALRSVEKRPGYTFSSTVRVYNEAGELVEETSF